jgi:hypothetical protein
MLDPLLPGSPLFDLLTSFVVGPPAAAKATAVNAATPTTTPTIQSLSFKRSPLG